MVPGPERPGAQDRADTRRRVEELEFRSKVQTHFPEVARILVEADDIHDASAKLATLLDVDAFEIEWRLGTVPLFSLTRRPTARRAELIRELRETSTD